MYEFEITSNLAQSEYELISHSVTEHGRMFASDGNAQPIACLVRRNGKIIGGAMGRTEYDRLFVNYLWVREDERLNGAGSSILIALEKAALGRDCKDALIEAVLDDVARFYLKQGYEHLAKVPNYVGSFTKHILVKSLKK